MKAVFLLCMALASAPPAAFAQSEPAIGTSAGPDVPFQGCYYYEHADFAGERAEVPLGIIRRYVGDSWNDRISAVACSSGCALRSWEHSGPEGQRVTLAGAVSYVGDAWNDRISAVEPVCGDAILTDPRQFRSGAGKCLDVHAPDQFANGARVQVWDCNGSQQQTWAISGNTIRSGAGKCLDVHAPDQRSDGGRVQVWDCNGSSQQRWTWDGRARAIRNEAGKCLDVHAPDQFVNGATVQVWDCNATIQQTWDMQSVN